jgi:penicillin-binding protein 1C
VKRGWPPRCCWRCLHAGTRRRCPRSPKVRAAHAVSDLTLLDRHGTPLQTLRVDKAVRRLPWVPLEDLSPALRQAIVLSEDRRFWDHSGVDWAAVATSAWGNLLNTRTRGASTLTMQLAGLIDDGLARPARRPQRGQKLGQVVVAGQLERSWTKSQILEAYLNAVPFRGEVVGVNALSQTLFGKHPSGLDAHEAAIAAALVRGPNAIPCRVADRACGVLQLMQLDCAGLPTTLAAQALQRRPACRWASSWHRTSRAWRCGATARRCSAARWTPGCSGWPARAAPAAGRAAGPQRRGRRHRGAGQRQRRGAGLGGRQRRQLARRRQVDGVLARRQPGSTLKPFVYGLAFEQRLITPASLLDDSPAEIATAAGLYLPQNYDRAFKGLVSARTALAPA